MRVCVAGWHFDPRFYSALPEGESFAVCHRAPPAPLHSSVAIPNVGLEFGCYDWYLKNKWEGGPVLFTHDDNEIPKEVLDAIASLDCDQAFLFASEAEAKANGGAHGRAIFCSDRFLRRLKEDGGFWFDETPSSGEPVPPTSADAPDYHNMGIQVFRAYLSALSGLGMEVGQQVVVSGLRTGYRGRL